MAIVAGLGQMTMTAVFGYVIALALGMTMMTAFYVAAAPPFSSTVIIVKLLSDKREIDALLCAFQPSEFGSHTQPSSSYVVPPIAVQYPKSSNPDGVATPGHGKSGPPSHK